MTLTSLMMYISLLLLFILYVYSGFSEAAPRISTYDASSISGKSGSASDAWDTFRNDMLRSLPESWFTLSPSAGLAPLPTIVSADPSTTATAISKTPTTDPTPTPTSTIHAPDVGIIPYTKEQTTPFSRLTGVRKRSADARTSLFTPEKMLQTLVSMVSQRTANDAWAADNIGTSVTSVESSQGESCEAGTFADLTFVLRSHISRLGWWLRGFDASTELTRLQQWADASECIVCPFENKQEPRCFPCTAPF